MRQAERRIVITGMGAVTPLGTGNDIFWDGLSSGRSGVRKLHSFDTGGVGTQIASEVLDFDAKKYVRQRKMLKVMARDIQLGVGAAEICITDAGLDTTKLDPTRFGVNCGAGLMCTDLDELGPAVHKSMNGSAPFDLKKWGSEGLQQLFPLWMLKYLPNMPACHISITYDAQGPNNSITAGEASSTLAMGEAYRIIARGTADIFVTGGTDSRIHPLNIVRLALLGHVTKRWQDQPEKASRPFDIDRDGISIGEGAGMLIFEELAHAKARNAKIYAEVFGFGSSCNAGSRSAAIEVAVRHALNDSNLKVDQLGHISAAGISRVQEDREEAIGLGKILGDSIHKIPVVAYKSYFGQIFAGAGAVELIASVLGKQKGVLVPTLNFERPDPDVPKLRILKEAIEYPDKPFVTYSVSNGGQCGALVVGSFRG